MASKDILLQFVELPEVKTRVEAEQAKAEDLFVHRLILCHLVTLLQQQRLIPQVKRKSEAVEHELD